MLPKFRRCLRQYEKLKLVSKWIQQHCDNSTDCQANNSVVEIEANASNQKKEVYLFGNCRKVRVRLTRYKLLTGKDATAKSAVKHKLKVADNNILTENDQFVPNNNKEFNCILVKPENIICEEHVNNDAPVYQKANPNNVKDDNSLSSLLGDLDFLQTADCSDNSSTESDDDDKKDASGKVFCNKCYITIPSISALKRHNHAVHAKIKIWKCQQCGIKCNGRAALNMHLRVHTDVQKYKCVVCNNPYKCLPAYKRHLLTHADLRPYACKYCEQRFRCCSTVTRHNHYVHPNMPANQRCFIRVGMPTMCELLEMVQKKQ